MNTTSTNHIAIEGYDPVSFFDGHASPGKQTYTHTYAGKTWRFVTTKNRDRFAINPEAYIPQFDGNCALAVSLGQRSPGKPASWCILDDKLYFGGNAFATFLFKLFPRFRTIAQRKWLTLS
ncbi:MAG: YHS domain-containing (seleno)protein [bacterium]